MCVCVLNNGSHRIELRKRGDVITKGFAVYHEKGFFIIIIFNKK